MENKSLSKFLRLAEEPAAAGRTEQHSTRLPVETLIPTKPNYTKPNQARQFQTKFDQPKLAWYAMHSRIISSFCLLLAILFTLVILQNCDSRTFVAPGIAEPSSAIKKDV